TPSGPAGRPCPRARSPPGPTPAPLPRLGPGVIGRPARPGAFADLQAAAVGEDTGQIGRLDASGGLEPLDQGHGLEVSDGLVAPGDALGADEARQAFDLLGRHGQAGEVLQQVGGAGEGGGDAPGVDDLALYSGAVLSQVDAQALALREKKPAGSGGSIGRALASRRCRRRCGRCAARGAVRPGGQSKPGNSSVPGALAGWPGAGGLAG